MFLETYIEYPPLVGRLLSGLHTFVDGHIYYSNNVIKIRYDIINEETKNTLKENELFDYYFNIFPIDDGSEVKEGTPLDGIRSHKFAYITSNKKTYSEMKIYMTPYLHEKKIFLNR